MVECHSVLGAKYERNEEISAEQITDSNTDVIKTRARKAMERQTERTIFPHDSKFYHGLWR